MDSSSTTVFQGFGRAFDPLAVARALSPKSTLPEERVNMPQTSLGAMLRERIVREETDGLAALGCKVAAQHDKQEVFRLELIKTLFDDAQRHIVSSPAKNSCRGGW
jgi:hypothetical protein